MDAVVERKRHVRRDLTKWAQEVAEEFGLEESTVLGIYESMFKKSPRRARRRTINFFTLYLEGKEA